MNKQLLTQFKIIKDKTIHKDIKLYFIMRMLYTENISLNKAYELCTENRLFSEPYQVIDTYATEIFERFYKEE